MRVLFLYVGITMAISVSTTAQSVEKMRFYKMSSFIDKGNLAPKEYFTGSAWVNMNIGKDDDYNMIIGTVTFDPRSRTNWHTHTTGQILFVIEGTGYYQEKGKPIQLIQKGDVIKIAKGVLHWHGASQNSLMRHIAIVPELDKDKTEWLQPVTDDEYNSYLHSAGRLTSELRIIIPAKKKIE